MEAVYLLSHNDAAKLIIVRSRPIRPYPRRPGELLVGQTRRGCNIEIAARPKREPCPDFARNESHGARTRRIIRAQQIAGVPITSPPANQSKRSYDTSRRADG